MFKKIKLLQNNKTTLILNNIFILTNSAKVIEINPDNKDASNQILVAKQKLKQTVEREKAMYMKMFSSK